MGAGCYTARPLPLYVPFGSRVLLRPLPPVACATLSPLLVPGINHKLPPPTLLAQAAVVDKLLAAGADPNGTGQNGVTPLLMAASMGGL